MHRVSSTMEAAPEPEIEANQHERFDQSDLLTASLHWLHSFKHCYVIDYEKKSIIFNNMNYYNSFVKYLQKVLKRKNGTRPRDFNGIISSNFKLFCYFLHELNDIKNITKHFQMMKDIKKEEERFVFRIFFINLLLTGLAKTTPMNTKIQILHCILNNNSITIESSPLDFKNCSQHFDSDLTATEIQDLLRKAMNCTKSIIKETYLEVFYNAYFIDQKNFQKMSSELPEYDSSGEQFIVNREFIIKNPTAKSRKFIIDKYIKFENRQYTLNVDTLKEKVNCNITDHYLRILLSNNHQSRNRLVNILLKNLKNEVIHGIKSQPQSRQKELSKVFNLHVKDLPNLMFIFDTENAINDVEIRKLFSLSNLQITKDNNSDTENLTTITMTPPINDSLPWSISEEFFNDRTTETQTSTKSLLLNSDYSNNNSIDLTDDTVDHYEFFQYSNNNINDDSNSQTQSHQRYQLDEQGTRGYIQFKLFSESFDNSTSPTITSTRNVEARSFVNCSNKKSYRKAIDESNETEQHINPEKLMKTSWTCTITEAKEKKELNKNQMSQNLCKDLGSVTPSEEQMRKKLLSKSKSSNRLVLKTSVTSLLKRI